MMFKLRIGLSYRLLVVFGLATVLLLSTPGQLMAADTATIIISTNTGNDTLVRGIEGAVIVSIDPVSDTVWGGQLWFKSYFSNGNFFGPLLPPENPVFSARAISAFESRGVWYGEADDPDSMLIFFTDLDGSEVWIGEDEIFRLVFVPVDTGRVTIDLTERGFFDPRYSSVIGSNGEFVLEYDIPTITVVDCADSTILTGDANFDRAVTSADVIYLVNHTFKSGPEPVLWNLGDGNCDGKISSADIVVLVNYVFKSGPPPCDVCSTL